jgi:hypothetical protein
MEEMRQRLEQDGYLFVKGLIPREDVLDEREKYVLLRSRALQTYLTVNVHLAILANTQIPRFWSLDHLHEMEFLTHLPIRTHTRESVEQAFRPTQ